MKTSLFHFDLPPDLIAAAPACPRESARLLHILPDGTAADAVVGDLPDLLRAGDLLVFNDTKVIPARLFGTRGQAAVELTLFKQINPSDWEALVKNARRLHAGDVIVFDGGLTAEVLHKTPAGPVAVRFNQSGADLEASLNAVGTMPLPPYIKRPRGGLDSDKADYQTIFARNAGAVAAPTAGLHFTEDLLRRLDAKGIDRVFITLHVGGGTFLPVKTDDTDDHRMHAEYGVITAEAARKINAAKRAGRRVIPVGTTALRLLESAADDRGYVRPFGADTRIFITPGYAFKCADALWTNFHLSESTLFMLVCAFAGVDVMKRAYAHAMERRYRFFSYGDACLIESPARRAEQPDDQQAEDAHRQRQRPDARQQQRQVQRDDAGRPDDDGAPDDRPLHRAVERR